MHSMKEKKARRAAAQRREVWKRWGQARILASLTFWGFSMPENMAGRIAQAVERAVRPLRDEIGSLKEKTAALEATQATLSDNQFIQLQLIRRLKEAVRKEPDEDSPLIDELYNEMKAMGRKQTDFATAARMVRRSKARLFQLKPAIALDQRFILIPSEGHSQKILIRLREFDKTVQFIG